MLEEGYEKGVGMAGERDGEGEGRGERGKAIGAGLRTSHPRFPSLSVCFLNEIFVFYAPRSGTRP